MDCPRYENQARPSCSSADCSVKLLPSLCGDGIVVHDERFVSARDNRLDVVPDDGECAAHREDEQIT